MRRWATLFLVALSIPPVKADLKQVEKSTIGSNSTVFTAYSQGRDHRIDNGSGHFSITLIRNGVLYRIDTGTKQYEEPGGPGILAVLADWIARPPRVRESGKTVNVYYDSTDTGESRRQFGFTAKHLILRVKRIAEAGACAPSEDTISDGWYVSEERDANPVKTALYIGFIGGICRDRIVVHGNEIRHGFALQETVADRDSSSIKMTREVIELSTLPLDKSVFEVPSGFKRVESSSWSQRMSWEWDQLVRATESWTD